MWAFDIMETARTFIDGASGASVASRPPPRAAPPLATGQAGDAAAVQGAVGHYADHPPQGNEVAGDEVSEAMKRYAVEKSLARHESDNEAARDEQFRQKWREKHGRDPEVNEMSVDRIDRQYSDKNGAAAARKPDDPIDLGSADARLKFLSTFAQNQQGATVDGGFSEEQCATTSLLAGMILTKGTAGVTELINACGENDKASEFLLKEVKERIAAGEPLRQKDMDKLKVTLYQHFNETLEGDTPGEKSTAGIQMDTLKQFMKDHSTIASNFEKHNLSISGIDTDNDNAANHAVLVVKDKDHNPLMVYDPYARNSSAGAANEAQQVTANPEDLRNYRNATREGLR